MAKSKKQKGGEPRKKGNGERGLKGAIKLSVEPPPEAITQPETPLKQKPNKKRGT